jgi:imidazolonepropionase-like amidohydrolase
MGDNATKYPPPIRAKIKAATDARSQMFKDALRIGVVIGFGTDSAVSPHGVNAMEFSLMTGLGMKPVAALKSAMSIDATLLGVDKQTGTLDVGKLGDIVAVPGNPLADIKQTEHVVFVMRAGKIYKRP